MVVFLFTNGIVEEKDKGSEIKGKRLNRIQARREKKL